MMCTLCDRKMFLLLIGFVDDYFFFFLDDYFFFFLVYARAMAIEVKCNDPGAPDRGSRSKSNFTVNSVVRFDCQTGYRLNSSSPFLCTSAGVWNSTTLPSCTGEHTTADVWCAGLLLKTAVILLAQGKNLQLWQETKLVQLVKMNCLPSQTAWVV